MHTKIKLVHSNTKKNRNAINNINRDPIRSSSNWWCFGGSSSSFCGSSSNDTDPIQILSIKILCFFIQIAFVLPIKSSAFSIQIAFFFPHQILIFFHPNRLLFPHQILFLFHPNRLLWCGASFLWVWFHSVYKINTQKKTVKSQKTQHKTYLNDRNPLFVFHYGRNAPRTPSKP
eukprot:559944_1